MDWMEGDLVWFDPGVGHPIPGEIQEVHRAAQVIVVQALIKGKLQTFALQPGEGSLRHRQDLGISGVEDMTQLNDLHEASLLWNLRVRYDKGLIYTYAGSILVAVNPYKMFPESYGIDVAKQYAIKPMGTLPPHLFAIGAAAHAALPSPQVVVISGESGSGKTESTKLVMQYLAAVVPGGGSASSVITEQILEAAPLLEAFGNARTARNDNSSRFGKYLEVYFKSGAIVGAKITQYLLEKSRIVTQAPGERNYHVFYEMLGGLNETEKTKYGLLDADKYFYLNQGATDCAAGRVDWESLQSAMQVLGVSELEREGIIKVLASVLHLGNVYFHRRQLRHGQEGVEVGSDAEIKWAAHLLNIPAEGMHRALTSRTTEARSERLHTPLSIDQALDSRDAFAKALYSGLFNWLVSRINSIVQKGGAHDAHRISILDIFGFEDLAENSFEQLCINYANENLQLYFNKHVFKLEQAEYSRERLEWTPLTWDDNLPVIHLLAKKPVGIFHLLDDESNFPRASDMSFLEKCHYNHALNDLYSRPRIGAQEFGITHYAGQVWYNVEGFLDKNRDALRTDVIDLLSSSKMQLVVEVTKQLRAQRDYGKTLPKGSNGRFVTMKPRTPTVAARFSDSLQQLLQSMGRCNPWFVRCVKPNNDKQALKMDMPCVLQQLRYLGMLDTIQIRQRGYPVRLKFQHFVERYRHLLIPPLPKGKPYRELCRSILESMPITGIEGPDFQLGASRVFLREALHRLLEKSRSDCNRNAAIVIQKNVRKLLVQRQLHRKKKAAIVIQSNWRSYRYRSSYKNLKNATIKAQSLWRGKMCRKKLAELRSEYQKTVEAQRLLKVKHINMLTKENYEKNQVIHLDIPAELAFIFSKIEDWTPVHGDRNLVKVLGTVPGPPAGLSIPGDLDQFSFGKFSSVYCNGIRLNSKREPISSPFLTRAASRDQDFQDSIAVFKLILRYANDKMLDSSKEKSLADYIVQKGISSRGLRDEILVQLCNQVSNADIANAIRIWQLLGLCLSSFQPGPAFNKYLMKFIIDNAPEHVRDMLLKKLLRNSANVGVCRNFVPSWLEYRAISREADIALPLTLPNDILQTVAIDSWTTCEEAALLAISQQGIVSKGWTIMLDDGVQICDTCGLDYILDLISEKELCPAFPSLRNDLMKTSRNIRGINSIEMSSLKRPEMPPPDPPKVRELEKQKRYSSGGLRSDNQDQNSSNDGLSRSSVLNDRYFDQIKNRSKSLDDLLSSDTHEPDSQIEPEPLNRYGLAESRLNDRYHSTERLGHSSKESAPRFQKSQNAARKAYGILHSNKFSEKGEYINRSSAMSDTSEAPSLASHVRRVRVPSQASDVDQFLDDLFSPVLDGSLDELSDARSLAASIRGAKSEVNQRFGLENYIEAPICEEHILCNTQNLVEKIKGGSDGKEEENKGSNLDEYITGLFKPIFIHDNIKTLAEQKELIESIKGGGVTQPENISNTHLVSPVINPLGSLLPSGNESFLQIMNSTSDGDPSLYQHQVQRAFLQSAMAQNLQIQQQLLAQNQALQTLLSQQDASAGSVSPPTVPVLPAVHGRAMINSNIGSVNSNIVNQNNSKKQSIKSRLTLFSENEFGRKISSEKNHTLIPPPPPPPMPPPIESKDPSETRHFLDPYGRAKTVRIGKWRWPPPQDGQNFETEEDFFAFKIRQSQRKTAPPPNMHNKNTSLAATSLDWDEFDIEPANNFISTSTLDGDISLINIREPNNDTNILEEKDENLPIIGNSVKATRKSFQIGAERPHPGSVGKLKLSTEMRQRLEQVTAGHSVRSSNSVKSEQRLPSKLEDTRRLMLQQQLCGHFVNDDSNQTQKISVRSKIERMERKSSPPPQWPSTVPPAPNIPAPPPPIKPPNIAPPSPPPIPKSPIKLSYDEKVSSKLNEKDIPSFIQRQDRDTFGVKTNWNANNKSRDFYDSWGKIESSKLDKIYEKSFKDDAKENRSRSRSRSRDREDFSESVWDRAEVEGPHSSGSDRERDQRDRLYEIRQVEREKESKKVYQPQTSKQLSERRENLLPTREDYNIEKEKFSSITIEKSSCNNSPMAPTFKTHMAQKYEKERKRKASLSSSSIQTGRKNEDASISMEEWPLPPIPAPIPVPPGCKGAATACLTYNRITWKLRVRKEVFYPNEAIGSPAALDLIFLQIVADVYGITPTLRLSPQEIDAAKNLLNSHGVTIDSLKSQNIRAIIKRHLIDMARAWPLYFSRLFPIQGVANFPDVSILGISHNGINLARRDGDYFIVVETFALNELKSAVTLPRPSSLQLNLTSGKTLILHAVKALSVQTMITEFVHEFRKTQSRSSSISSGARAAAQTLNVPLERLETRQINPRDFSNEKEAITKNHEHEIDTGKIIFDSFEPKNKVDAEKKVQDLTNLDKLNDTKNQNKVSLHHEAGVEKILDREYRSNRSIISNDDEDYEVDTAASVTKYSLLQFAMQHFRNDQIPDKHSSNLNSVEENRAFINRSYAELVKWQGYHLRMPLLRLPTDLAPLALECFDCILRYCGDLPIEADLTEVKCVYTVLMHCHKYLALRDEVYCQLMKQTTANRSACPDSIQRAWRLLSILAAYFGCSDALRPYLMEHLSSAASDRRRSCHGTAAVCLTNLRKTARCGGRKNVPSVEEVTAVSAGRSARRQIYRLPGGAERVVNTRCSTVVADVIAELCELLGIESDVEQQEFSLYCIVQGDAFTMPLSADEYILDVTTELLKSGQPFYLIFCRSVWHFPLKRDPAPTTLYIEVLFNQVAPDYLEGLLLELPANGIPMPEVVRDMAHIAALLHRAADLSHVPAMKEIKFLLPKPALGIREIRPAQWVGLVQSSWPQIANLTPGQVKAQFLNILSAWHLFGSSFFAVKRIWSEDVHLEDSSATIWRDLILALNRKGVLFLDPNTHETLQHWPFMEIISTRKVRSEDGALFLDLKVGNLMQQRVIRVQTEQAHEISRLIRQYITMAQIGHGNKRE